MACAEASESCQRVSEPSLGYHGHERCDVRIRLALRPCMSLHHDRILGQWTETETCAVMLLDFLDFARRQVNREVAPFVDRDACVWELGQESIADLHDQI